MEYTEQEPLTTKEFVFKEGPYGEEHKVELCSSPMTHRSFTRDFATMVQLFISMMKDLDFSHPFRMVIEYDPERLRVKRDVFAPKEVVERYIQQVMGNVKD